jgi:phytanoyl-CoA hydroxylase
MWIALEEVNEENGWVSYVKGSHLKGMRSHGKSGTIGFSQHIVDFGTPGDIENEEFMPVNPGDVLVHHALTIHRAAPNNSLNNSRKALGLIYFGASAKEDIVAKKAYVSSLNQEN